MEKELLEEFWALGLEELKTVRSWMSSKGILSTSTAACPMGRRRSYYGAEVCKRGSERCYGLAADEGQLVVYEYGNGGADAELVVWKRRG